MLYTKFLHLIFKIGGKNLYLSIILGLFSFKIIGQTSNVLDFVKYGHPMNAIVYYLDTDSNVTESSKHIFEYNSKGQISKHKYRSSNKTYIVDFFYNSLDSLITTIGSAYYGKDSNLYFYTRKEEYLYDKSGVMSKKEYAYLGTWYLVSCDQNDVFRNEKDQIIKINKYSTLTSCRDLVYPIGYTEFKYKNDELDSTIYYEINESCYHRDPDTAIYKIVNYYNKDYYKEFYPSTSKSNYYITKYDSLNRKTQFCSIDSSGNLSVIGKWHYNNNEKVWTRYGDTTITRYDDHKRVVFESEFRKYSNNAYYTEYNNLFKGDSIEKVSEIWGSSATGNKPKSHETTLIVYGYQKLNLYDDPVGVNEKNLETTVEFLPNPSHGNITLKEIEQLDQLIITYSDGRSESLDITENIQLNKPSGVYNLTFVYRNQKVKHAKLILY